MFVPGTKQIPVIPGNHPFFLAILLPRLSNYFSCFSNVALWKCYLLSYPKIICWQDWCKPIVISMLCFIFFPIKKFISTSFWPLLESQRNHLFYSLYPAPPRAPFHASPLYGKSYDNLSLLWTFRHDTNVDTVLLKVTIWWKDNAIFISVQRLKIVQKKTEKRQNKPWHKACEVLV